jgi:putative ABC transport system permease protein
MAILQRSSWRYLLRHPWLLALSVVGVALGVAVVVAVDLANESARRAFALSMDRLTGKATHHLLGSPAGFPEGLYKRLRVEAGEREIAPVVEGYVSAQGETLHLLGVDPFAEGGFRGGLMSVSGEKLGRLLTEPNTVLISSVTAERLGLEVGDRLNILVAGAPQSVVILDLLRAEGQANAALEGLMIADIASAQEILNKVGKLDRIDLTLAKDQAAEDRIRPWLPDGIELVAAKTRNAATAQMTRAFGINLRAMSLLALVVGMFLIYNTMTFSVLQRRGLIGTLRVLGLTPGGIFRQVLSEAALIGFAGTLLGIGLGLGLGQGLVHLVTRTINDLYFVLTVNQLLVSPGVLIKGLLVGVAAAVVAALGPAIEAARLSPSAVQHRSTLEHRAHRLVPGLAIAGALLLLLAGGLLLIPSKSLILGFVALFVLIVGASLTAPLIVVALSTLAGRPLGWLAGSAGRLAARSVAATLSRTGMAIAALAVAVSATVGVGIMVGSFRATVDNWIQHTLQADIYVAAPPRVSTRGPDPLPPSVLDRVESVPGVAETSTGRALRLDSTFGPVDALILQPATASRQGFRLKEGDMTQAWRQFSAGKAVLVSEPLAYRHQLAINDSIQLHTDQGVQSFPIGGIFYDYGSDQGMILIPRKLYDNFWNDRSISSIGLYLDPTVAPTLTLREASDRVRKALAGSYQVEIRSNREIRELSLQVFDRTFAITNVLRLLAMGVAFIGILTALMAQQLERAKEVAILRATGFTPRQVWGMVTLQTGFMGFNAALLALPLGWLMSLVLIVVINQRSFGWSMDIIVPGGVLLEALALALAAAILAGLYPAWRMARAAPADALREE